MAASSSSPVKVRTTQRAGRSRPALLVAAAAWLLAAGLRADVATKFRLEEALSIGGPKSDLLSLWVGAAVDGDGFLYVTDALEAAVKKFGPDGRLIKSAPWAPPGSRNLGVRRYPLDVSEGRVYVVVPDPFQSSIKAFDADLNLRTSIPLPDPADDLQALPGGLLAYSSVSMAKDRAGSVRVIDGSGRLLRVYSCRQKDDLPTLSMIDFRFDADGSLYVVFNYLDRILKLDGQGRLVWARSLLGVSKVKTKKILFHTVPETPTFKDIALDGEGRVFVLGGGYSKNRSRDVYVLDSDGRLLDTLTLPQSSHCLAIDRFGHLYARADRGMTLKKYRMIGPGVDDERR